MTMPTPAARVRGRGGGAERQPQRGWTHEAVAVRPPSPQAASMPRSVNLASRQQDHGGWLVGGGRQDVRAWRRGVDAGRAAVLRPDDGDIVRRWRDVAAVTRVGHRVVAAQIATPVVLDEERRRPGLGPGPSHPRYACGADAWNEHRRQGQDGGE